MSEGIIVNYWLKNSYKLQVKLVKFNTLSGRGIIVTSVLLKYFSNYKQSLLNTLAQGLQESYLTTPAISSGFYSTCSSFSSLEVF